MNAFAFVTAAELKAAPDPRKRLCPFCSTRAELTDEWQCTACGKKVVIHCEKVPCDECGAPAYARWFGNRKKSYCPCRFTSEEQEAISIREVAQERAKAIQQRKEAEAEMQRIRDQRQADADRTKAAACWKGRNHDCKIPKANLLSFCGQCARFKPTAGQARLDPRVHMEDYA